MRMQCKNNKQTNKTQLRSLTGIGLVECLSEWVTSNRATLERKITKFLSCKIIYENLHVKYIFWVSQFLMWPKVKRSLVSVAFLPSLLLGLPYKCLLFTLWYLIISWDHWQMFTGQSQMNIKACYWLRHWRMYIINDASSDFRNMLVRVWACTFVCSVCTTVL